jgi:peptidoglycan hydrolase CwlO-like protein
MTQALETTQSELVTLRKELAEQRELLQTRKTRKKGKRVALKGRFVFSTTEVLQIAKEAEEETAAKKGRKRPRKRSISVEIMEDWENVPENVSSESESDCFIVAKKRST